MKIYVHSSSDIFASSFNRAIEHMNETQCGFITAFRDKDADGNTLSNNQKRSRNKELEKLIKQSGLTYIKATGGFVENKGTPDEARVTEDTFCVINNKYSPADFKKLMCYWCGLFDQDAVLITEPKHSTRKDSKGNVIQLPEVIDVTGTYYKADGSVDMNFSHATIQDAEEYFTSICGKDFVLSSSETFDTEGCAIYTSTGRIKAVQEFKRKYPEL